MAKNKTVKKVTKKPTAKVKEEIKVEELESPVTEETVQAEPEDNATEEVEVINGDPSVVIPTEEVEVFEDEPADEKPMVDDPVTEEGIPAEPLRGKQEEAPALKEEIIPKKNVIKHLFGYIWNGQEMDY